MEVQGLLSYPGGQRQENPGSEPLSSCVLVPAGTTQLPRESAKAAGKALQALLSMLDPFSRCLLSSRVLQMGCRDPDGSLSQAVHSWEGPTGHQARRGLKPAWLLPALTLRHSPQVEEFRKKDAERGLKIAQVLQGFISRKVVKQTVMTVVYGVTRYGGRLQIEKRLKEIDEFPEVAFLWVPPPWILSLSSMSLAVPLYDAWLCLWSVPGVLVGSVSLPGEAGVQQHQGDVLSNSRHPGKEPVALYLHFFSFPGPFIRRQGDASWGEMVLQAQRGSSCPGAEVWRCTKLCGRSEAGLCWEGMGSPSSTLTPAASSPPLKNWLTESAKLIAQSGRTVEWVTPLGLPIVQPYYRSRSTVVSVQRQLSWPTFPVPWWEQGKDSRVGITGG